MLREMRAHAAQAVAELEKAITTYLNHDMGGTPGWWLNPETWKEDTLYESEIQLFRMLAALRAGQPG